MFFRPSSISLQRWSGLLNTYYVSLQDADGKQRDIWGRTPIRVTDLAISPDFSRLVAVGMCDQILAPTEDGQAAAPVEPNPHNVSRIVFYQLSNKQEHA